MIGRLGFGCARRALGPFIDRRFRWMLVLTALIGGVIGLIEASLLRIVGELISTIEVGDAVRDLGPFDDVTTGQLIYAGTGATVGLVALRFAEAGVIARIGISPLTAARSRLASAFLHADHRTQQMLTPGSYHELIMAHSMRLASIAVGAATMVSAGAVALAMSVAALVVSPATFAFLAVLMAAVVAATSPLNSLGHRLGGRQALANAELANASVEAVDVSTDARLYGVEDEVLDAMDEKIDDVSTLIFRNSAVTLFGSGLFQALMLGVLLAVTGILASLDGDGFAAAGTVALIALRAQMAARRVLTANLAIANSAPFADELEAQISALRPARSDGQVQLDELVNLEARNVWFAHHGAGLEKSGELLCGVDLTVARGEHVGIVGPSGSGKSTLLSILLGLVEPQQGRVLVNGIDRRDLAAESIHRHIAAVQQRPRLLSATVAENVRFFRKDVSDAAIVDAALAAGIHDEVASWPDGFQTRIGERGGRQVSGGQAQRISIARALVTNPTLLIMDEPTSSIDDAAERLIVDTISQLGDRCAAIIVSHRASSLRSCDRILQLVDHRLVELP